MQVILFDLDGTLTDSAPGITRSVKYALEKMGRPNAELEDLVCFVGPPLKEQFMRYADYTEEQALEAIQYYRERYSATGMFENEVYPGIEQLLQYLTEKGRVLAVASSKPEVYVRQILEHFGLAGYFQEIVGATLNDRTDKAEVIEEALRRLDMSNRRQDVIMVGDRAYDVVGARHCGIQCVGVTYGYGSREELIRAGVVSLAESVEDLEMLAPEEEEEAFPEDIATSSIDVQSLPMEPLDLGAEPEKEAYSTINEIEALGPSAETVMQIVDHGEPVQESFIGKLWRIIYPVLIHYGVSFLVSVIGSMAITMIGLFLLGIKDEQEITDMLMQSVVLLTGVGGLVSLPFLSLFIVRDRRRRESGLYAYRERPQRRRGKRVLVGTVLISIALCQILNDLIIYARLNELFPGYAELQEETMEGQSLILIFAVVVILGPIAEELTFRALVQQRIRDYIGAGWSILFSSLMFGIYHGNAVQFIYATLLGLFLGYTMEVSQNVWIPIAAHITANLWATIGASVVTLLVGDSLMLSIATDGVMLVVAVLGWLIGFKWKKAADVSGERSPEPEKSDFEENNAGQ